MTEEDARETIDEQEPEPEPESPLFRWFKEQAEVYAKLQRGF